MSITRPMLCILLSRVLTLSPEKSASLLKVKCYIVTVAETADDSSVSEEGGRV